jgi:predicted phosphodiesterase
MTRFGVMADVHGNLHALDAVLAFLSTRDVDRYLCAGDLVGYGPQPNECVRRVLSLPGACVAGNHDLIALGRLGDERCAPLARRSLRWTRGVLEADARAMLASLPLAATCGGRVAIHHGSLADPEEYVLTEDRARQDLQALAAGAAPVDVLILGQTHRPMAVGLRRGTLLRDATGVIQLERGERIMLNPGSVGQSRSRDPSARVAILDLTARAASFHAVAYDVDGCRRALRERGLPERSCHLPRPRWERVLGSVWHRVRPRRPAPGRR